MQRAAKRNAIDRAMADALDAALNELDDDDQLWAGILTGTADVFSAGSDLTAGGDYVTDRGGEYGLIRRRRRKPLIAAVEGPALGGGLELVLACDLVVAAHDRPLRAARGAASGWCRPAPGCSGRPRALPLNVARQLILTGRPIDAPRAYEVGFVNVLTETGACARRGACPWRRRSVPTPRSPCRRAWPRSTSSPPSTTSSAGSKPKRALSDRRRVRRRPGGRRRLPGEAATRLDGPLVAIAVWTTRRRRGPIPCAGAPSGRPSSGHGSGARRGSDLSRVQVLPWSRAAHAKGALGILRALPATWALCHGAPSSPAPR